MKSLGQIYTTYTKKLRQTTELFLNQNYSATAAAVVVVVVLSLAVAEVPVVEAAELLTEED